MEKSLNLNFLNMSCIEAPIINIRSFVTNTSIPEGESKVDFGSGGALGRNTFPGGYTESVWIATFTFFVIWLLALVISPLAATVSEEQKLVVPKSIRNFCRAARDSFLILLGITTINQSGYGVSQAIMILTWVVFVLLILWTVLQVIGTFVHWPWWVDSLVFLPIMVISIIEFGMAFRGAPSYR